MKLGAAFNSERIRLAIGPVPIPVLLTLFLSLGGCASADPAPAVTLSSESFGELKERIARLRGLPFKREVSLVIQNPDEFSLGPTLAEEFGAEARLSHAYQRLGFVPQSVNLAEALTDYVRLQRPFFFDPRSDSVVVSADATKLSRPLFVPPARGAELFPMAFALAQALQSHHFRWHARLESTYLVDRKLAFRSLEFGEAMLVSLAAVQGGASSEKPTEQLAAVARFAEGLAKMAAPLPDALRERLAFPYREGTRFVQWAQAAGGWKSVNSLFAEPPLSTAQMLHPEKFFVKRQEPLRIFPWGFLRRFKGSASMDQTLGEAMVQILLRSYHSAKKSVEIASGWRGDYLSTATTGEQTVTVWISAWNDETSALEFFRAYETVLSRFHRLHFAAANGRQNSLQAASAEGHAIALEVRGVVVVFLDGIASSRVAELADEIWQDLEVEAELSPFPFDTARKFPQSSRRSR